MWEEYIKSTLEKMADDLYILEKRMVGAKELIRRLKTDEANFVQTCVEVNFARYFIDRFPDTQIHYEPSSFEGKDLKGNPPDLVFKFDGTLYWIQVKCATEMVRDRVEQKIINRIKKKNIKIKKIYSFSLIIDEFIDENNGRDKDNVINELVKFICDTASDNISGKKYIFPPGEAAPKAWVNFSNRKKALSELTYEVWYEGTFITGESPKQIQKSLERAVKAFKWDTDENNINLIAIEMKAGTHDLIDAGEAVFGKESIKINKDISLIRNRNGFFYQNEYCSKVAGVIIMLDGKTKALYINEKANAFLPKIKLIMDFDKIYQFNTYICCGF